MRMTLHPSVQSESPDHGQQRASSRLKRTAPPWLCQALVLSGAGLLGCPPVEADTFRIEPSIGISETLTNNVNLAPRDSARSDLVTQLTPTVSISESGARARLNGTVSLPIVLYARTGSDNDQVYTQANLNGNVEVLDKFFFIDGSVTASQQYFSPLGAQAPDLSNATQNRYTTRSYTLSPYVKGVFQGNVNYLLRDVNIWTNLSGTPVSVNNSYTNNLAATLSKSPVPFGWSAEYNRTQATYSPQPRQITQLGRLRLIHQTDPQLELSASAGYENDDYTFEKFRSSIYGVGTTWRPTERTNLEATWEHRFFGTSYLFNFSHRMPLSVWSLNASRNITSYPQQLASLPGGFGVQPLLDQLFLSSIPDAAQRQAFINQFIRDRGLPAFLSSPVILYTESVTLAQQASATVGLLGARNSVFFSVFYVRQEPVTGLGTDLPGLVGALSNTKQRGVGATWTNNLAPKLTFVLTGNVSRGESDVSLTGIGSLGKTSQGNVSAALTSPLSPTTYANAGIRYQTLRSDSQTGYTETAVYVSVTHAFR